MGAYGVFQHSIAAEKRKECATLLVQRQRAAVARRSVRAAHDHGVEQRHEPRAVDELPYRIESNRIESVRTHKSAHTLVRPLVSVSRSAVTAALFGAAQR